MIAKTGLLLLGLVACRGPSDVAVHRVTRAADRSGPRILCVVAHPDDEIAFAGTLYKTATFLDGAVDVCVITNGEGGFKYATLAEPVYGLELTDEAVGRRHLPAIRERELLEGCAILGVRDVYLLGQKDHRYTQDEGEVVRVWDYEAVQERLAEILERGRYDFVFTLAPHVATHGHHKAATLLALRAAAVLPASERPVVLCASGDAEPPVLEDDLQMAIQDVGPFVFDRTQKFGYRERLDYRIVVNWAIAAHKSQGTMQLRMNRGEREHYFLFASNGSGAADEAGVLFEALAREQFEAREYGPTAGTNARMISDG
ncbi:MAG: PIG-L family deacetylase [Planctomycetota bacterium]|nr:PIG-L family deacetylase [Planctomycetota bacterium]